MDSQHNPRNHLWWRRNSRHKSQAHFWVFLCGVADFQPSVLNRKGDFLGRFFLTEELACMEMAESKDLVRPNLCLLRMRFLRQAAN